MEAQDYSFSHPLHLRAWQVLLLLGRDRLIYLLPSNPKGVFELQYFPPQTRGRGRTAKD